MGAFQDEEVVGGSNPQAFSLSFIPLSEDRIRPITAQNTSNGYDALFKDAAFTLPGGKKAAIDYYITDYRSDVRMPAQPCGDITPNSSKLWKPKQDTCKINGIHSFSQSNSSVRNTWQTFKVLKTL